MQVRRWAATVLFVLAQPGIFAAPAMAAMFSQTTPRPVFPSYFEPGEASVTTADLSAKCGYKTFAIGLTSTERTTIRKFRFADAEISVDEYRTINAWVSSLRGQVEVRVQCNSAGVKLVLTEAFNRDKNERRMVDFQYVGGSLHLNNAGRN